MKNKNLKIILIIAICIIVASGAGAYAVVYNYFANDVSYSKGNTKMSVAAALDELYETSQTSNDTANNNTELFDMIYPVGSIYISTINVKPSIGTWEAFGEGRTLIGAGTGDDGETRQTFAVNDQGGEYKHILTGNESGQKNLGSITTSDNNRGHTHNVGVGVTEFSGYGLNKALDFQNRVVVFGNTITTAEESQTHTHSINISSSDAINGHNNVQPYIVTYMWRRTD